MINNTDELFDKEYKYYSLSKPSTIIAPIDAGIEIIMILFNVIKGSINKGSLFIENNTKETTKKAIE